MEPKNCPGFIFRRSVMLGSTDISRAEFRSLMERLSGKYHGDTYHLIAKNCNHFSDEVCLQLTGKPIPGWVNRLARFGKLEGLLFVHLQYMVTGKLHVRAILPSYIYIYIYIYMNSCQRSIIF